MHLFLTHQIIMHILQSTTASKMPKAAATIRILNLNTKVNEASRLSLVKMYLVNKRTRAIPLGTKAISNMKVAQMMRRRTYYIILKYYGNLAPQRRRRCLLIKCNQSC